MKMMIPIISRADALVLFHLVSIPESSWIKANIDGVVHPINGLVAIGGVLRDKHGEWILGFYRSIGNCLVLLTDLEVVRIILGNSNALSDYALVFAIGQFTMLFQKPPMVVAATILKDLSDLA
ncbi:hypothetical protein GQ457_04G019320 [Hibiscus cannabinus]